MFQYLLAFLLINSCYQSLGVPLPATTPNNLLSKSLLKLAGVCENAFLASQLKSKIKDCAVFVPPYSKKQFQCLIFYDINMQLCSAVANNKLTLNDDYLVKVNEKQDINNVCTLAKDWVFTNITDYENYKVTAENSFKLPASCGDICGVDDALSEANYYCKYYMLGIDMLKTQLSTTANQANNNVAAPVNVPDPDANAKADIPVPVNSNPINPQDINTHKLQGQIQQTEPGVAHTSAVKEEGPVANVASVKSDAAVPSTPQQTSSVVAADDLSKNEDADVNVEREDDPSIPVPDNVIANANANKSTVSTGKKPVEAKDEVVPEAGKDLPVNAEQKEAVLDNPKPKGIGGDTDDYADSEGNDNVGDDDGEDTGLEIQKPEQDVAQNTFSKNKLIVPAPEDDAPQKEYFPNTIPDGFTEDSDHFFPFFMTSVVLMVLLYVLYHNKSKVSKVFFGLILEGRQSGRRRNSRGHSYRRLDTLEQAMNTNTAAPPSKIIY
ncbi:unnamed protein product [Chrysodeixis includens]|uniref:Uncharacterized protein n=1 Tax=Chrysodeixis includens TaxID=689277 RepID=A0A9P0BMB2_CHRIL|nr:unnamed protein product [Chrysodeixis includens]